MKTSMRTVQRDQTTTSRPGVGLRNRAHLAISIQIVLLDHNSHPSLRLDRRKGFKVIQGDSGEIFYREPPVLISVEGRKKR